jgi:DNA-binding transcriptional MerR regulator
LHHYDELGLLTPSGRSQSGYRLYTEADLKRLQQLMLLRELGLPLEEIRGCLERSSCEVRETLQTQRLRLLEQVRRTTGVLRAIDHALQALNGEEIEMSTLFEGTESFGKPLYPEEATERWGQTAFYQEAARRTKQYGKAQWSAIKVEGQQLYEGLAQKLKEGRPPNDPEVMALAEQHRLHIDRWFYPCSHDMHVQVSQLYVQDPRFRANIDAYGEGVAAYLTAAIEANRAKA